MIQTWKNQMLKIENDLFCSDLYVEVDVPLVKYLFSVMPL